MEPVHVKADCRERQKIQATAGRPIAATPSPNTLSMSKTLCRAYHTTAFLCGDANRRTVLIANNDNDRDLAERG